MGHVSQRVHERFPQWVLAVHAYRGDETVILKPEGLREVCAWLRDEPGMAFAMLMDATAVDYLAFGKTQAASPTLRTPSPLPYFMKPQPPHQHGWCGGPLREVSLVYQIRRQ